MGRFSPTTRRISPLEVLAGGVDAIADRRDDVRFRKEEDEARSLREALTRLELNRAGVREGEAPTRQVTVRDELPAFEGERPGMARREDPTRGTIFEGARPGMAGERPPLSGALSQVARRGRPREPELVARAGAFVPGVGFAPRHIFDTDLPGTEIGMQRPATAERDDPRYQQLNDEFYLDTEGTPEARQARAGDARRDRMSSVLAALRESGREAPPEVLAEALELGIPRSMMEEPEGPTINVMGRDFPDTPEGREAALEWRERASAAGRGPDMIRIQGRDFPNTQAGERAALAWREALAEAGRTGGGAAGSAERITGEVTRRTLATAAARALANIQQDVREMTAYERKNLEPQQIQQQIEETLALFGFSSAQELESEMRELRIAGTGQSEPPAGAPGGGGGEGGGGRELTDAEIDAVLDANPNATNEEILQLLQSAERGG